VPSSGRGWTPGVENWPKHACLSKQYFTPLGEIGLLKCKVRWPTRCVPPYAKSPSAGSYITSEAARARHPLSRSQKILYKSSIFFWRRAPAFFPCNIQLFCPKWGNRALLMLIRCVLEIGRHQINLNIQKYSPSAGNASPICVTYAHNLILILFSQFESLS
jgi:hypothetical protein